MYSPRGDGFPLAAFLAIVASEVKEFAPILEAHIYAVCPMAIPTLPKPGKDASEEELMESLGMAKNKNGEFETFERFLHRTEGIISMVANIMASHPESHSLFGGHKSAIKWLERFLVLLPPKPEQLPLNTAPVLDAFLTGAGHMLANLYASEFKELLDIIMTDTILRLDEGSIGAPRAHRLKKTIKDGFEGFRKNLPSRALDALYNDGGSAPPPAPPAAPINQAPTFASSAAPPNPFGAPANSNPPTFGASPFGQTSGANSNSFGGQQSHPANTSFGRGGNNQMNAESGMTDQYGGQPSPSPFGATATSTPFGAQAPGQTPFGAQAPAQTPFGAQAPTQTPFGAQAPAQTPFGAQAPGQSPFGAPSNNPSTFGAPNTTSAPFGGMSSTAQSPFGGGGAGNTPFGGNSQPQQSTPFGSSYGGGNANSQSTPFGNNTGQQQNSPAYGGQSQGGNKAPCKFFAQGTCRYGDKCRFSHEGQSTGGGSGGGFGAGNGSNNNSNFGSSPFGGPRR